MVGHHRIANLTCSRTGHERSPATKMAAALTALWSAHHCSVKCASRQLSEWSWISIATP